MSHKANFDTGVLPAVPPENIDEATGLVRGSFGVGTYEDKGRVFPGLVQPDGTVFDISDLYRDTHALFDDWANGLDKLADLAAKGGETGLRLENLRALPVVAHPNVLATGANYRQHVAEMMTLNKFNQHNRREGEDDQAFFKRNYAEVDRRGREGMPYFWTGLHSALTGANDDVVLPPVGEQHDWELELGVIVGGAARLATPEEAGDLIAGYVMVNDLGTVDEFRRADVNWGFDWISKSQPGFFPTGPFMVPKQFVDRTKIQITMKLNGEVMQDWPASDVIFTPEQVLSYASERIRLVPGDLLLSGSPPGNGAFHGGRWLKPGDVIESSITYLGRQTNKVVAEQTHGRKPTWGAFKTQW